eukprot:CAMPEP_0119464964 /NCGR_PEP_ID=MMETSP1344-20130328/318_1 /TAXON_ID=236787 /ORGANISM="Florenciella parvula, Strain CCMP2471" /LENGTH=88 /DNA_ID=CAMNT_0007497205 /DNA_START=130 /DNA_END=399 /DNA_ORIENTATION=+
MWPRGLAHRKPHLQFNALTAEPIRQIARDSVAVVPKGLHHRGRALDVAAAQALLAKLCERIRRRCSTSINHSLQYLVNLVILAAPRKG